MFHYVILLQVVFLFVISSLLASIYFLIIFFFSFHLCVSSHIKIICISVCSCTQRCTLHFLPCHSSQLPHFHSKIYYHTFFHIRTVYRFFFPTIVSYNIAQNNVILIDSTRPMLIKHEVRPFSAPQNKLQRVLEMKFTQFSEIKLTWE